MPDTLEPVATIQASAPAPLNAKQKKAAELLAEFEIDDPADFAPTPAPKTPATPVPVAVETPKPPEVAPPSATPRHTARLLRMAQTLGIPREFADRMTPEELDDEVYHRNLQALSQHRVPATPPPPPPEDPIDLKEYGVEDEEQLAPELVKFMRGLARKDKGREKELAQIKQQREVDEKTDRLDNLFLSQPSIFGKQRARELVAGSQEALRRNAVLAGVASLRNFQGSYEEAFAHVAKTLFGAAVPAPVSQPTPKPPSTPEARILADQQAQPRAENGQYVNRITEDQWNGAALAQPTQRDRPIPTDPQAKKKAAEVAVADLMRAKGFDTHVDHGTEADELPD